MKICPVVAEFFHGEGQTEGRMDRHADRSNLIVAFRSFAQAPANTRPCSVSIIIIISNHSNDRSKASRKTVPPHSAIYSFLLQFTVSSPVLKVVQ